MRIDLKINLLLDLVGHVVARSQSRPAAVPVRFNTHGIVWTQTAPAPQAGTRGIVEIHLRDALVEPLALPGVVAEGSADGHVHVRTPMWPSVVKNCARWERRGGLSSNVNSAPSHPAPLSSRTLPARGAIRRSCPCFRPGPAAPARRWP